MLDVVVVEVIFFCRRNVILHGFLDKILWVCGLGVVFGFFFSSLQVFGNFASCGNFVSL